MGHKALGRRQMRLWLGRKGGRVARGPGPAQAEGGGQATPSGITESKADGSGGRTNCRWLLGPVVGDAAEGRRQRRAARCVTSTPQRRYLTSRGFPLPR